MRINNFKFNNIIRLSMIFIFYVFSLSAYSSEHNSSVPKSLFELVLGKTYTITNLDDKDFNAGDWPVKRITGISSFPLPSPYGKHIYFQPLNEYKAFEYFEHKEAGNQYYRTSFGVFAFPDIPKNITTVEQMSNPENLTWKVASIRWTDGKDKDAGDNYYWASDMCKTFEVDLGIKPVTTDQYDIKNYICEFKEGNRIFKVYSGLRFVELAFDKVTQDKMEKEVEAKIRRAQAKDIRPY